MGMCSNYINHCFKTKTNEVINSHMKYENMFIFIVFIWLTLAVNSNRVIKLIIDHNLWLFVVVCFKPSNMRLALLKHFLLTSTIIILSTPKQTDFISKLISNPINKFGDNIFNELIKTEGNIIFSSFSLYFSLMLLTLGINGTTQEKLLSKLSLRNLETLKNNYKIINKYLENLSNKNFHFANTLFITKQYELFDKEILSNSKQVDYTQGIKTLSLINDWVANETNKEIQNIIKTDSFNKETFLMLLSAIYFKSNWKFKFNKELTVPNYNFHTPKGIKKCRMMIMKHAVHHFHSESNILTISPSLSDTDIKIAFVTTIRNRTIRKIEKNFNSTLFFYVISQLRPVSLIFKMPGFKFEGKYKLNEILTSLGLTQLFQNSSFSMFKTSVSGKVDKIIQKNVIKINEEGKTQFSVKEKSTGYARVFRKFVLDKPFLFLLYDQKSRLILLRGRIEEPTW